MYYDLRLAGYLEIVCRLYGRWERADAARRLSLDPYLTRPLAALSGGLQRRAVFAAAILPHPATLILDEPTVGLDPVAAREVRALLADAMADRTVLLCTHNLAEAEELCDTVVILRAGQVVLHDRIDALRGRLEARVRLRARQGPATLDAFLRRQHLTPIPSRDADEDQAIDIAVAQPEEHVPGLLRALLAEGLDVYEARVVRPSLEDLFFHALEAREPAQQPVLGSGFAMNGPVQDQSGSDTAMVEEPVSSALPRRTRVRALLWKELRQLPRKRSAVVSTTLFPLLLLFVMPVAQMVAISRLPPAAMQASRLPAGIALPEVMDTINRDPAAAFHLLTLPLVVLLGGLIVPSVLASHTVVVERERRTLDLLVALPVTLGDVLWAKLSQTVLAAGAVSLPLFLIDAAVATRLKLVSGADLLAMGVLLVAALTYSTAGALAVGLLAGDFRTANNVSGAVIGPLVLAALGLILVMPPGLAPWTMAAMLLALAAIVLVVALRWVTVERLLR